MSNDRIKNSVNSNNVNSDRTWKTICEQQDLIVGSGVCALLENDQQVAIFHTKLGQAFSISNWDPAGQANVLYRGIIGEDNGEIYVASPLYKERYSLSSGQCLDNDHIVIKAYQTRVIDNKVQILL